MAAPTPTPRASPTGIKLRDGYQSLITLGHDANIEFWEKNVKPPGMDGGDAVDQTTMHNLVWRTTRPRQLKTLTEVRTRVAYDPQVYVSVLAAINREDTVTVEFYDGSTLSFYGFLRSFEPAEMTEGQQPEADIAIMPTNYDYVNHVEAGPALASVVGS